MKLVETYYLKQQTPMIHFQSKEVGATLRVSEVKPKLDRFIIAKMGGEDKVPPKWWIECNNNGKPVHPALNYKMRFKAEGNKSEKHRVYKSRNNRYRGIGCYFFTEADEARIKGSSFHTNIQLDIICFYKDLASKIEECLCEFFALHNFGFRQNKGFGSFILEGKEKKSMDFAKKSGFYLKINSTDTSKVLEDIKKFYQELKNGINIPHGNNQVYRRSFLMKNYFSGHLNDKKAMKLAMINIGCFDIGSNNRSHIQEYDDDSKPERSKITLSKAPINDAKYIRGLLGFANFYTFRNVKLTGGPNVSFNVTFKVDGGEDIERFQTPILFKPIMENETTYVYLLFDEEGLKSILGKEVKLQCEEIKEQDLPLNIPEKELIVAEINKSIKKIGTVHLKIPDEFPKSIAKEKFLSSLLSEAFESNCFSILREVK